MIYILLLNKEKRKLINILLFICMITFGRYVILFAHAYQHSFFDYRALLSLVIVALLIICEGINYENDNINTLPKQRRNNQKSNKINQKLPKKSQVK